MGAFTDGGSTASGRIEGADGGDELALLMLLTIEAACELIAEPDGVGTISAFFSISPGNCSCGRNEGGFDPAFGVLGLLKWTSSGDTHVLWPEGPARESGVPLLMDLGDGRGGM